MISSATFASQAIDIDIGSVTKAAQAAAFQVTQTHYEQGEKQALIQQIKQLLRQQNAVLVAHYYTDADLQQLAEETGGAVADSLEMARFGHQHSAKTLVVAGVKFMGETAKILNPEKRVLMPDLSAECSLDLECPSQTFNQFCDQYPDHTVVVYANTSAEVKARSDWVVTSGIALPIIKHLASNNEKIIWAPDKHLGAYIHKETHAEMILWPGSCIVHEKFKAAALAKLKTQFPDAAILVHPESPEDVIALADVVGSTTALIKAAKALPAKKLIVATDNGIFYKMQQAAPDKILVEAPNAGIGATCESCAHCPWMAMNNLRNLADALITEQNEIQIDDTIRERAYLPIKRMLDFAETHNISMKNKGNA